LGTPLLTADEPTPTLSIVVTLVSGRTEDLASCLESVRNQERPPALEIVVPYDDPCSDVTRLGETYPGVRFIKANGMDFKAARDAGSHEPYDVLRTIGLKAARGQYVALTEDQATLGPEWCRTLIDLLEEHPDLGAIGGAIECGSNRLLNRAICYCDFGRYQSPLPEGPAAYVSDTNVVYRQAALDRVRSVWDRGFREVPVHRALIERGRPIWLTPRVTAWQNRPAMTFKEAFQERCIWGRAFAGIRFARESTGRRFVYACLTPALPLLLTYRLIRRALSTRHRLAELVPALPYIALLNLGWACGEFVGYLTGRPSGAARASHLATVE
jgi:hypothetical protein